MGGFKIEKKPEQNSFCSRTNLSFVQNKSPEICSVDIERTKILFRNNLFMMMPRSSLEGFGDLNPYDDAV